MDVLVKGVALLVILTVHYIPTYSWEQWRPCTRGRLASHSDGSVYSVVLIRTGTSLYNGSPCWSCASVCTILLITTGTCLYKESPPWTYSSVYTDVLMRGTSL